MVEEDTVTIAARDLPEHVSLTSTAMNSILPKYRFSCMLRSVNGKNEYRT